MSAATESRTEPRIGAAFCTALGVVGTLFVVINPFAGMIAAVVALAWSLVAAQSRGQARNYRIALWVATAALLINVVMFLLSLAVTQEIVGGETFPVTASAAPPTDYRLHSTV